MGWLELTLAIVFGLISLPFVLWAAGVFYFDVTKARHPWAWIALGAWIAGSVFLWYPITRPLWLAPLIDIAFCFAIFLWWRTLKPQAERDWLPEFARGARCELQGDEVVIRDIRNGNWRTREDFDLAFDTRTYRPADIARVDLLMSYWAGRLLSHPIIIFDFGESVPPAQRRLCWSVEARHTAGGGQLSVLASFYRAHELICMALDERDILTRRLVAQRDTQVYLYPLLVSRLTARRLFLQYVELANRLAEKPRWYNALTTNCLTAVYAQTDVGRLPFDWRLVASGFLDNYLYDRGLIDRSIPFAELRSRCHINARLDRDLPPDRWGDALRHAIPSPARTHRRSAPRTHVAPPEGEA